MQCQNLYVIQVESFQCLEARSSENMDMLHQTLHRICSATLALLINLSVSENFKIERLQKRALRIIMGTDYPGYEQALEVLNLPSLKDRREQLTKKFANSVLKSQRHRNLLPQKRNNVPSIRGNVCNQLIETKCNRERYFKKTIPYCTRLINKDVRDKFYRTNL